MILAFIISTVIAGILFFLWLSGRDRLEEAENKVAQLSIRIDDIRNREASNIGRRTQTPLTPELIRDVIRSNGFIPLPSDDPEWIPFKWQGEVYFVSSNSLPGIQFYKGFSYKDGEHQDLLKKAAEMAKDEIWYGHINFTEDEVMSFRIFAIEKSLEHFTESFMDYMRMLENLIDCHRHFYQQMLNERETFKLNEQKIIEFNKKQETVS